ncbi:MAG: tetratricopeptide repeat protein [Coxiellaceae bacterium]|nr:MAG: tetratricopeptide repeat protein [Coxiellaceae bacterium]
MRRTYFCLGLLLTLQLHQSSFAAQSFVDEKTCVSCHQAEYTAWHSSHHAMSMQIANEHTVLGDFNQAEFADPSIKARFFKKQQQFYINTLDANGRPHDYLVRYTFGVAPLQQYLVEFPGGRLQAFPIAWDTQQQRWFHLAPTENTIPHHSLYWGKRFYNWNLACADCHSTNLNKNYDPKTQTYHTTWSVMQVGCQACHGPAKDHLVWAEAKQQGKNINLPNAGFHIQYHAMNPTQWVETCAFCHARRYSINPRPQYGTPLLDNYVPEIVREQIYYADGGIQDEDFEYGSFMQGKMAKAGVICADCHDPHTVRVKTMSNQLCTQCHNPQPPKQRFPLLLQAKDYNTPEHTHHPVNSSGSQCINCHMPPKTYMNVDVRRDHYFRIPRPDLTTKYGIPNACNTCHQDKSADWAQRAIVQWYGNKQIALSFTDTVFAARKHQPQAEITLIQLANDPQQSAIARATAAYLLQDYVSAASVATLETLTTDSAPLVRMHAVLGLDKLPMPQRITVLAPLLNDPVRAVRIEAAKTLAAAPASLLTPIQQRNRSVALAEYKAAQQAVADAPEANLNLAELAESQGNVELAQHYYHTALQLDPNFYPASQNLAVLYNARGENTKAEKLLRQAVNNNPDLAEVHYSLGLLLAEENKLTDASTELLRAYQLKPADPQILYNLVVVLLQAHQWDQANTYAELLQKNIR